MENYLFKVIMGGCVGNKRREIMCEHTHSDTRNIIGVDFAVHCVDLPENESAKLDLCDIAEEKRFFSLIPNFCQGASGALLFFDLHNPESIIELDEWVNTIREHTNNIPIIICGVDGKENEKLQEEHVFEFITEHQIDDYIILNMEHGCDMDEAFDTLTELMVKIWPSLILHPSSRTSHILPNQVRMDD